jgi:hypothetical protein
MGGTPSLTPDVQHWCCCTDTAGSLGMCTCCLTLPALTYNKYAEEQQYNRPSIPCHPSMPACLPARRALNC